jgi:hypothetical protein
MNAMKRSLAVLAGAVVVFGVVYLVKAHRESEKAYEALRLEMAELRQADSTNARQVLQPQIVRIVEKAEETQGTPKGGGTDERAPRAEEPKPAKAEMSGLEMAGKLRDSFATEQKDPNWSADTEEKVSATFSRKLQEGSLIRSLECRSTMCLVELQQKTLEQFQKFVDGALIHTGGEPQFWGPASAFVVDTGPSGEVSVMVALAREGHELPSTD